MYSRYRFKRHHVCSVQYFLFILAHEFGFDLQKMKELDTCAVFLLTKGFLLFRVS